MLTARVSNRLFRGDQNIRVLSRWKSFLAGDDFSRRHIGPNNADIDVMLRTVGCTVRWLVTWSTNVSLTFSVFQSLEELTKRTVPHAILMKKPLELGEAVGK